MGLLSFYRNIYQEFRLFLSIPKIGGVGGVVRRLENQVVRLANDAEALRRWWWSEPDQRMLDLGQEVEIGANVKERRQEDQAKEKGDQRLWKHQGLSRDYPGPGELGGIQQLANGS